AELRANRPNQIRTIQRRPRLSRGMTTGTIAPWSPPRSSPTRSLQEASVSLMLEPPPAFMDRLIYWPPWFGSSCCHDGWGALSGYRGPVGGGASWYPAPSVVSVGVFSGEIRSSIASSE